MLGFGVAYYTSPELRRKAEIDSRVDAAFVRLIVEEVTAYDVLCFSKTFSERFVAPGEMTAMIQSDDEQRSVLRAFMVVMAIALHNVADVKGKEEAELIPFVRAILYDSYFESSMRFIPWVLFGVAVTEVRSNEPIEIECTWWVVLLVVVRLTNCITLQRFPCYSL